MTEGVGLTQFQIHVANQFFRLAASSGYAIAGGAGLIASSLISRPTQDLDLFTYAPTRSVMKARGQFLDAARESGWITTVLVDSDTFCRIHVIGPDDEVLVDLAIDSPPTAPPTMTVLGPSLTSLDLAGRKLLALLGRAEARDFADVFVLAQTFGKEVLVEQATLMDPGFNRKVLAEMVATLARFDDDAIPLTPSLVTESRDFYRDWGLELDSSCDPPGGCSTAFQD